MAEPLFPLYPMLRRSVDHSDSVLHPLITAGSTAGSAVIRERSRARHALSGQNDHLDRRRFPPRLRKSVWRPRGTPLQRARRRADDCRHAAHIHLTFFRRLSVYDGHDCAVYITHCQIAHCTYRVERLKRHRRKSREKMSRLVVEHRSVVLHRIDRRVPLQHFKVKVGAC